MISLQVHPLVAPSPHRLHPPHHRKKRIKKSNNIKRISNSKNRKNSEIYLGEKIFYIDCFKANFDDKIIIEFNIIYIYQLHNNIYIFINGYKVEYDNI